MWTTPRQLFHVLPSTEQSCPLAGYTPPTGYEPNVLDDFHYSETTEMSSRRNPATRIRSPRTCVTRNSTMRPSGKRYLHYCSFGREKNQRTEDKIITLLKKVCCQLSPFPHTHKNGETRTRTQFVQTKTTS